MPSVRRVVIGVAGLLLFGWLCSMAAAAGLDATLGRPAAVKGWLAHSRLYETFIDTVLAEQQKRPGGTGQAGSVPLDDPAVQTAAKTAFSPQLLQSSAETVIDGTYGWLEGTSAEPAFRLDLAPAKVAFANQIGTILRQRAAELPVCSQGRLPDTFDLFQLQCRPAGLDIEREAGRLSAELASSPDFIADTTVTPDDLKVQANGVERPFYEQFGNLPSVYGLLRWAPWLFGFLSLLAAGIIIFSSSTRLLGLRRVATITASAGVFLLLGGLLTNILFRSAPTPSGSQGQAAAQDFQVAITQVAEQASAVLQRTNTAFGLTMLLLAGGLGIVLYVLNRRHERL